MIHKKVVGWSVVALPIGILALDAFNRWAMRSVVFENVLGVLVFPVVIYNHFTHANEGPLNLAQVALLLLSGLFWGFIIERFTHIRKRTNITPTHVDGPEHR